MKKIREWWKIICTPIYVGKRLRNNLLALTWVSCFTAVLGLVLVIFDLVKGFYSMLIPSFATLIGGTSCAIIAGVLKKREIAILIPTGFCMIAFTYYALTGAANGTAIYWSFLMPIGMCYFVSVKYGLILSAYYTVFFSVLFYSPLKQYVAQYYDEVVMSRFPMLFGSLAIFTGIAMVQYHRVMLADIEYSDRLSREVEEQTKTITEQTRQLEIRNQETILMLARVIDAKDNYTNGHSFRVSVYSVALARRLGWSAEDQSALQWEALLHDIGKVGVPDHVLNKPGRLTDEEFEVVKSHTTVGGDILQASQELVRAADVARYHHERYDGKGYPSGLAGEEIPAFARAVSIADAYDAMHSDRIYRKGLSPDVIRSELEKGRGTQFDPAYVDVFLSMFDSGELEKLGEVV